MLVIGCVNIANLLLARGAARRGELAVRLALGAGGWRVVRQLLIECLMLAVLGGVLSIAVSRWTLSILLSARPDRFGVGREPGIESADAADDAARLAGCDRGCRPGAGACGAARERRVDGLRATGRSAVARYAAHDPGAGHGASGAGRDASW